MCQKARACGIQKRTIVMEYTYSDFIGYIQETLTTNWDLDALTDYEGTTLQYKDVARKIEKLHILFENAGVKEGDKIDGTISKVADFGFFVQLEPGIDGLVHVSTLEKARELQHSFC